MGEKLEHIVGRGLNAVSSIVGAPVHPEVGRLLVENPDLLLDFALGNEVPRYRGIRINRRAAFATLAGLAAIACATTRGNPEKFPPTSIHYNVDESRLSVPEKEDFLLLKEELELALPKIMDYLQVSKYRTQRLKHTPYTGDGVVEVYFTCPPLSVQERLGCNGFANILRGEIYIPLHIINKLSGPHEATHILGGGAGTQLTEGLAVYMAEKFGSKKRKSSPNYGEDVHKALLEKIKGDTNNLFGRSQITIENFQNARLINEELAYLQAGSFVEWIDKVLGHKALLEAFWFRYELGRDNLLPNLTEREAYNRWVSWLKDYGLRLAKEGKLSRQ